MKDITITIIAIVLAGVLIFLVPLMTYSDRIDNVTQEKVKLIVDEFVAEMTNTGKMTRTMYQNLVNKLEATGNTYDIQMEFHILDENPDQKLAQSNHTKIGENLYVIYYNTQILSQLGIKVDDKAPDMNKDVFLLNPGDEVFVKVQSETLTDAQTYKSSILGFSNVGEYAITADSHGMVTVKGAK